MGVGNRKERMKGWWRGCRDQEEIDRGGGVAHGEVGGGGELLVEKGEGEG